MPARSGNHVSAAAAGLVLSPMLPVRLALQTQLGVLTEKCFGTAWRLHIIETEASDAAKFCKQSWTFSDRSCLSLR